MAAAKFVEGDEAKGKRVSDLPPALVYQLASKSTPPEIVNEVLDRAANGEVVKDAELKAKIRQTKGRHQPTRKTKAKTEFEKLVTKTDDTAAELLRRRMTATGVIYNVFNATFPRAAAPQDWAERIMTDVREKLWSGSDP